jgi:hypothetical protein
MVNRSSYPGQPSSKGSITIVSEHIFGGCGGPLFSRHRYAMPILSIQAKLQVRIIPEHLDLECGPISLPKRSNISLLSIRNFPRRNDF